MLLPPDSVDAMRKLASKDFRVTGGVSLTNNFLFASSHGSEEHVSGWHALNSICKRLSLHSSEHLIATNNRHRISTLFASLDLPRQHRELFYTHMGHSEKMNQDVYQAPLAIQEITKVGRCLLEIDEGNLFLATEKPSTKISVKSNYGLV